MLLKTFVSLMHLETKSTRLSRLRVAGLIALVAIGGILPGLVTAACIDWQQRGGYEPMGHYFANSWNHWRAVSEPSPVGQFEPAAAQAYQRFMARHSVASVAAPKHDSAVK